MANPQPDLSQLPSRGHSSAPRFDPSKPRELRRYFDEINVILRKAHITDENEMKQWARHYVDFDTSDLWETLPEAAAPSSYDDWVRAVTKFYPGADEDRKWSIGDLNKLTGEYLRTGIETSEQLGDYYRAFYSITQYLIAKNRMSVTEQSRAYSRAFKPELWHRILRRLEVKLPDHFPDDPYKLADVHEAARFVLHGTTPTSLPVNTSASAPSQPASQSPVVKIEDISQLFDTMAMTFVKALQAQSVVILSSTQTNRRSNNEQLKNNTNSGCHFCGESGHRISACVHVVTYIADGKVK